MTSLSKSHRPQVALPLRPTDYVLEILAVLGLFIIWGLVLYAYQHLPAQIPMHFGMDGHATRMGHKTALWILPSLGLVMYLLLSVINLRPDRFNYLVDITPSNAEQHYRMSTRVVRVVKALVMFMFAFLTNHIIQFSQPGASGLNFIIFILLMGITLGLALYDVFKSRTQN